MSTKHNCKHPVRGTSGYKRRLAVRGESPVTVRMPALEILRARQERRIKETCTVSHHHNVDDCNGFPFMLAAVDVAEAA